MIRLGTLLIFFGVGSALLHYTSVQFGLLAWSEPMQPGLGAALGGAGLVVVLVKVALNARSGQSGGQSQPQGGYAGPAGFAQPGQPQFGAPQPGPQQFGQPQSGPVPQFGAPGSFPPPAQYGPPAGPQPVPSFGPPAGPQPVGAPHQFGPQFGPQGFQQPNPFERPGG
jgi:hypothetical protein